MDLTGADKSQMKIGVLLATYNGEKYLLQLLDSLDSQTYSDFVIYVHDDGSTDGTVSILSDWAVAHPGKMFVLEGKPCGSAKANFLWMLGQLPDLDYYLLCDQDDVWLPQKIEKCLERMQEVEVNRRCGVYGGDAGFDDRQDSSDAVFEVGRGSSDAGSFVNGVGGGNMICVFSDMYVVDESLNVMSDSFISYIGRSGHNTAYSQIMIDNPAAGCTMLFNKALRNKVVWAVEECQIDLANIEMHDGLILTLATIYGQVEFLNEPLAYYRQTGYNQMGATTENVFDKVFRNVSDIVSGRTAALKKEFVGRARLFAVELLKLSDLPDEVRQVLSRLTSINSKGKLARMRFYRKNNFTRASGNFWMRLWV